MKSDNTIEWRAVKDYEGIYEVSNTGLVKSLARLTVGNSSSRNLSEESIMKPYIRRGSSVCVVNLTKQGYAQQHRIYLLLVQNFGYTTDHAKAVIKETYGLV